VLELSVFLISSNAPLVLSVFFKVLLGCSWESPEEHAFKKTLSSDKAIIDLNFLILFII
jgi:hypothetical protein